MEYEMFKNFMRGTQRDRSIPPHLGTTKQYSAMIEELYIPISLNALHVLSINVLSFYSSWS